MKLDYKRTFFVGLAFLSICAFWQMYDNIIPLMLKKTFHLDETITGVLMALDNILALFMLPLFGAFSDKTNTPLGKRTPFILVGTILAVISMIFLPFADKAENLPLFLIFLGLVLFAIGSYRSPTVALMPDITPKPLRSKANAVINLMGSLGGVFSLLIIMLFVKEEDKNSYLKVFLAVAAVMAGAVLILLITIKEKRLSAELNTAQEKIPDKEKGQGNKPMEASGMAREVRKSFRFILASIFLWFFAYNAVTTAYSRYAEEIWGMKSGGFAIPLLVAMGAAIICYVPIGNIACRIGRRKTILIGIIMMTASYFCGAFIVHYSSWVLVVFSVTGIGWAAINVNSYPMVVEMCKGSDVGKYTGIYYMFSMSAQIVTPIVSGALLEHVSYRTLFPYAVIFSAASLCTMLFVRHGDSKPEKKADMLENFDLDD